jgi:hypothetical protein
MHGTILGIGGEAANGKIGKTVVIPGAASKVSARDSARRSRVSAHLIRKRI